MNTATLIGFLYLRVEETLLLYPLNGLMTAAVKRWLVGALFRSFSHLATFLVTHGLGAKIREISTDRPTDLFATLLLLLSTGVKKVRSYFLGSPRPNRAPRGPCSNYVHNILTSLDPHPFLPSLSAFGDATSLN